MKNLFEQYGNTIIALIVVGLMLGSNPRFLPILANSINITQYRQQISLRTDLQTASKPEIIVSNQRVPQNVAYDVRKTIKAIDAVDGDISNKIQVFGNVNTSKKGRYEIRAQVENTKGLKAYKNFYVLVD